MMACITTYRHGCDSICHEAAWLTAILTFSMTAPDFVVDVVV